ncbi:MAG: hypothetical protein LUC16_03520 [Coprobacillus sp.]|nr:hypothetical protein [Coprobacillus sp.]
MSSPSINSTKKYLSALKKVKGSYVTSEKLSVTMGIYPEVINDFFSYFDPMVNMDYSYNLRDLEGELKKYLDEKAATKPVKASSAPKGPKPTYESVGDFVYQKMTAGGGLIDRNAYLTDADLRALKKLITLELANRKKKD